MSCFDQLNSMLLFLVCVLFLAAWLISAFWNNTHELTHTHTHARKRTQTDPESNL